MNIRPPASAPIDSRVIVLGTSQQPEKLKYTSHRGQEMKSIIDIFKELTRTNNPDPCYYDIASWLESLEPGSMNYLLLPPRIGLSTMLESYRRWVGEGRTTMLTKAFNRHPPRNMHGMRTPEMLLIDNPATLDTYTVDDALIRLCSDSTIHVIGGHDMHTMAKNYTPTNLLKKAPATNYFVLPAITTPKALYFSNSMKDEKKQSCCPTWCSLDRLTTTRRDLGPKEFGTQYQHEEFLAAVRYV
jgi:hypothetical protein